MTFSSIWKTVARTCVWLILAMWKNPFYGLFLILVAPLMAYTYPANQMLNEIEYYMGTLTWVHTGYCKGVRQGHYTRVAPRPQWLNDYA